PTADGPLALRVELVEALGADTVVHGRLAGGEVLLVRLPGLPTCRAGDTITLAAPPDAPHLFDAGTGRRLES
ncbi:MAG TPA: TOBE domain-containing protein, partial [Azospirillum sp.]